MRTVQDYIDRYNQVAKNIGLKGESVELLVQLLSNATYINEVENISYLKESSIEKAALINSKIQHCMDNMYSVFRGSCPRVFLKIRPTKYLTLNPYDTLIESQNFKVYYLGYYQIKNILNDEIVRGGTTTMGSSSSSSQEISYENEMRKKGYSIICIDDASQNMIVDNAAGTIYKYSKPGKVSIDQLTLDYRFSGDWNYNTATFYPTLLTDDENTEEEDESVSGIQLIKCLIAPKRTGESLEIDNVDVDISNTYYVDCISDNLSSDVFVKLGQVVESGNKSALLSDMKPANVTRIFSEHILTGNVFDLTLPSFGSRLYIANYYNSNKANRDSNFDPTATSTRVYAKFFGFSKLEQYNNNELRRLNLQGAEYLDYGNITDSLGTIHQNPFLRTECLTPFEGTTGMCFVDGVDPDDLNTIHYKASRDRFVNSILRSNSDIGTVLEEIYPEKIMAGGTIYSFESNSNSTRPSVISIYYIPKGSQLLTDEEINTFKQNNLAYYVIDDININQGQAYIANFDIHVELFRNEAENYEDLIGTNILKKYYQQKFGIKFDESTIKEIEAYIGKLENVKKIKRISITYKTPEGRSVDEESILNTHGIDAYYSINYTITTSVVK